MTNTQEEIKFKIINIQSDQDPTNFFQSNRFYNFNPIDF